MLVVDEVRPTKDEHHASTAYNILKPMIVAPPDTLPLNDKYAKLRHIINRLRVFITTNDWMSMYIPPEDRRMFIMHSHLPQKWHERENNPSYFNELFAWFEEGGINHVAAWLTTRTLAHFDPKAQVARTAGWGAVAASWGEPEDAIAWVIDHLGSPDVVLGQELVNPQFDHHEEVANMLKSPRKISHRMNRAGYVQVPVQKTPDNTSDRWVFRKDCKSMRSRYAFVKADLSSDKEHARRLVMAHGESLVAKMAEEKVIPMPSRKG
jgi:hypothetical protein